MNNFIFLDQNKEDNRPKKVRLLIIFYMQLYYVMCRL